MSPRDEIICIDSSDDDDGREKITSEANNNVQNVDIKPNIFNNTHNQQQQQQQQPSGPESPTKILETRRKRIDDLLDLYEKCQSRVKNCLTFMNPEQQQRWSRLSSSSLMPNILFAPIQPAPSHSRSQQQPQQPQSSRFNYRTAYQSSPPREYDEDESFGLPRFDRPPMGPYGPYGASVSGTSRSNAVARVPRPRKKYRKKTVRKSRAVKASPKKKRATTTKASAKPRATVKREPTVRIKREF